LKFDIAPLVSYSATLVSLTLVGVGATRFVKNRFLAIILLWLIDINSDDAMQLAAALGVNDRLPLKELGLLLLFFTLLFQIIYSTFNLFYH
jgi:hypothetical protein